METEETDRFRRVKALYRLIVALPSDERLEVLRIVCPDDPEVRREVTRLISCGRDADVDGLAETISDVFRLPHRTAGSDGSD